MSQSPRRPRLSRTRPFVTPQHPELAAFQKRLVSPDLADLDLDELKALAERHIEAGWAAYTEAKRRVAAAERLQVAS